MTFNLLKERWIPARLSSGERRWIAPHEIAGDAALVDIDWGRPDLRTASYELLIGLLAVALADELEHPDDWEALIQTPPDPADLERKLAPLARYFCLDGEGPRFCQDLATLQSDLRAPDTLLLDAPGEQTLKNGADVFSKRGRFAVLSRAGASIALYTLQAFAPSGGAGHRTSMRGGGPLTTLVIPDPLPGRSDASLWQRIAANVPLIDDGPPPDLATVFPWAKPTIRSVGDRRVEQGPEAHGLQWFFGMPRRIRLEFAANGERLPCAITGMIDDIIVTGYRTEPWGVSYGVWQHPLSPYYKRKSDDPQLLPVHAQDGHIGYRDWVGYLFKGGTSVPALQVAFFTSKLPSQRGARLSASGFVTDNMKVLDWVEAEAPLFVLPRGRDRLACFARENLVAAAEVTVGMLRSALRDALDAEAQKTVVAAAVKSFWIDTDAAFFQLLQQAAQRLSSEAAGAGPDADLADLLAQWLAHSLRPVALRIFDATAPLDSMAALSIGEPHSDAGRVGRIIAARRSLGTGLHGYGKSGSDLFKALDMPPPPSSKAKTGTAKGATP